MKELIKLRDMTIEQWDDYKSNKCNYRCNDCAFYGAECLLSCNRQSWIHNKNIYSDEFLDRKIIIETSNVLDKEEKEYLSAVIKPFRNRIRLIAKKEFDNNRKCITININSKFCVSKIEILILPYFNNDMYKGMESNKFYTLEELGL